MKKYFKGFESTNFSNSKSKHLLYSRVFMFSIILPEYKKNDYCIEEKRFFEQ